MSHHRRRHPARLAAALALLGLVVAVGPALSQDKPREKTIAELRKQIDELNQRLQELEKAETTKPKEEAKGTPLPDGWLKDFAWRPIGPASMGGRITSLAVFEADPSTYWVATASGGLLKTENNGITFEHQFDHQSTVSIGDVAVAPSDRKIVWVGTGEANPRNSVSYGDGVYKSTDSGKSWTNMGLENSFQIGRIVIHPKDPNIVYVGALGRLWGANEERGLYKTTDGGKSWDKILYVDDKTGIIDLDLDPSDPETLLVATYQRKRDIYDTNDPEVKWGPGSGLHRSTDGGKTWKKVNDGLPSCTLGRIGIDYYRKDPKVVFAIVESEKIGSGPPEASRSSNVYMGIVGAEGVEDKAQIDEVATNGPAEKAGLQKGDIITEFGGKPIQAYPDLVEQIRAHKPGDKVTVKATRAGKPIELELTLGERPSPRDLASIQSIPSSTPSAASVRMCRIARARTATNTAASIARTTAASPGSDSTASTPARCTSARSESIRAMKRTSTFSASASTARTTVARPSSPTEVGTSMPTSTPSGSTPPTAAT